MKALLIKDFYTLRKQLKIFLILIIVFSSMPGYSISGFAVVYSAMLPITALAYDERSKWDNLAAMMPYSTSDIVISKYILGYISIACAAIISAIVQTIINNIKNIPFTTESAIVLLVMICIATIFLSVNLPAMFKMGVEKGRTVFFIFIAIIVFCVIAFGDDFITISKHAENNLQTIAVTFVLITIIINIISILISTKVYHNKK